MSRLIPIVSISILLLAVLGGYYFWWPECQHFQDLRLMFERKKVQFEQAEEYLSGLEALSGKLIKYEDELAKVDSALPLKPSIPSLFNFIQKTSSENGLILRKISLNKPSRETIPAEEKVRKILFSIKVSGSYFGFKNFLSAVYKNARIVEVNSLDFSSPLPDQGTGPFILSLELETYNYKE